MMMSFHEMINTILFHRKIILTLTVFSTLVVFLYLFLVSPLTYNAPVTILPPSEQEQMGGLSSLISGGDFSSLLMGSAAQGNSQLYIEILKSRSAAEYVVRKHDLIEYFDASNVYEACGKLNKKVDIELSKEGIITLSVNVSTGLLPLVFSDISSTKKFAADLSNSFVEALDKINREKISYKAKRAREYIEQQLKLTRVSLDSAEFKLMEFQKLNKTISLPEQLQAAIESSAKLKSEIIKTEVELGLLRPNLREDNPTLIALSKKLYELRAEYNKFNVGTEDYLVAFSDVPELGLELAKLVREVKIQNEVYLLLQQQYYKEKIQENRDLPTIEVLDEAIPPLKASAPRMIFSSVLSGIFIFLLISLYIILKENKLILFKRENKI